MKKRVISILLTAAMAGSLLAGCGSSSTATSSGSAGGSSATSSSATAAASSSSKESEAASTSATSANSTAGETTGDVTSDPVTITFWSWDNKNFQQFFDAYHEEHPNVTFELTDVEWGDMLTKVQQALASGSELPTIFPMDISLIGSWKQMDIFEDLTQYGIDPSNYNDTLIKAGTDDNGKLVGLFECTCPSGIAYKRDLAKKYFGTDDPDELQEQFASYDDYVEAAKTVSEQSGGKDFLFHSGQAVAEWLYFASEIPNADGNTINMTEKMNDVFGTLIDLRDAGGIDTYQNGTPEANATYADDSHIFYPCPDWAMKYYIEANDPDGSGNWGLIKAPSGYQHGGTALGISSAASDDQKAVAADFIKWLFSTEDGATVMKNAAGYITQDKRIATDEFIKRNDEDFFGGEDISSLLYKDIASQITIATPTKYDNDVINTRNDIAQQVMDDKSMTLDQAVSAAVDELKSVVTDPDAEIK